MASACRVDEDYIKCVRRGVADGILGDMGGVFAITFLVELDFPKPFTFREFFQIPGVDAKLLNRPGPEGVARGDEKVEVILEEEKS